MTTRGGSLAAAPPPELRFRRRLTYGTFLRELWQSRELVRTLAERELRVRYKQALLGFSWAVVTPLALMLVFTAVFTRVADIDTGGAPYALFSYLGLLPWTFFTTSVSQGGNSLINNLTLLNKVYSPREVFPISSVGVAGVDFTMALMALALLFPVTGYAPRATSYWVPVLLLIQLLFTVGAVLVVSSVLVYVRDVRHALPILLQLGLFATPVAYGLDAVPASLRHLYVGLNPLAAVIDGYRRTVLLGQHPDWTLVGVAAAGAVVVAGLGYALFKRLETGFADVA